MCKRMVSIHVYPGCKENTYAHGVAVALSKDCPLEPDYALQKVRRLKELVAACAKGLPADMVTPQQYPVDPFEFRQLYPQIWDAAYSDGPPVVCPLSWDTVKVLKAMTPCRSSRTGCNMSRAANVGRQLVMQQQATMIYPEGFQRQPSGIDLPGFRLCEPRPRLPSQSQQLVAVSTIAPSVLPPVTIAGQTRHWKPRCRRHSRKASAFNQAA